MRKEEHIFTRAKLLHYKLMAILTNFEFPRQIIKFYWVKCIATSSTLKIGKSKKTITRIASAVHCHSLLPGHYVTADLPPVPLSERYVDFYTLFVEPDRQIVLIIMTISVEIVYKKNTVTMDSKLLYHKLSNQYSRSF